MLLLFITPPSALFFAFVGSTSAHPLVDFGNLELPQAPNAMSRQALAINPPIDRIARDSQVLGDLFDGYPRLTYRGS